MFSTVAYLVFLPFGRFWRVFRAISEVEFLAREHMTKHIQLTITHGFLHQSQEHLYIYSNA